MIRDSLNRAVYLNELWWSSLRHSPQLDRRVPSGRDAVRPEAPGTAGADDEPHVVCRDVSFEHRKKCISVLDHVLIAIYSWLENV